MPELVNPLYPQEYDKWKMDPSPKNMQGILSKFDKLISHTANQYSGTIPPDALKSYAKKFAIQSVKKYDPLKSTKLSTWMTNYMKQLNRLNYSAQQAVRMPENMQMVMGQYKNAIADLSQELEREPTNVEISEKLKRPISFVEKLNNQMKQEMHEGSLDFDPSVVESRDPRLDYVYYDLPPEEKFIFEHSTGYGGQSKMNTKQMSEALKISEGTIASRRKAIAKKIEDILYDGKFG